jgi:hypothetical protein
VLLALVAWSVAVAPAWAFQTSDGATLYEHPNYGGQPEFFSADDPDLAGNAIGAYFASSVRVQGRLACCCLIGPITRAG